VNVSDTFVADTINLLPKSAVCAVLRVISFAEIDPTIISCFAIDVIHKLFRPSAGDPKHC